MSIGVTEFQMAAQRRREQIREDLAEASKLKQKHGQQRAELDGQRSETMSSLAAAVLPALTPEAMDRAVRLTGYVALTQGDPLAAIAAERQQLEARIAEIERDPPWVDRVRLRAPRTGDLVRQVAELEDFRAPLYEVLTRCEGHERFAQLRDSGYGTDAYTGHWWRLSYYKDWKAGDEIVELFPDKKSFAEVRADYDNAHKTIDVYQQRLDALRAEIAAGEALEKEHDEAAARIPGLPERHLATWRDRLVKHLGALEPGQLADRLSGEPDIELLLKQGAGLSKKIEYLDETVARQVEPHVRALHEEQRALDRDIQKYMRPKNQMTRFDPVKFRRRFDERPAKLQKSWRRTHDTYYTVSAFDSWQRARLIDDFLWWDLMTDGRRDGSFIPEVSSYHDRHPDYRWDRDANVIDDAVRAHVEAEQHDASIHHDVS